MFHYKKGKVTMNINCDEAVGVDSKHHRIKYYYESPHGDRLGNLQGHLEFRAQSSFHGGNGYQGFETNGAVKN